MIPRESRSNAWRTSRPVSDGCNATLASDKIKDNLELIEARPRRASGTALYVTNPAFWPALGRANGRQNSRDPQL